MCRKQATRVELDRFVALRQRSFGGTFLDYGMLQESHAGDGEALGMTLVEYGVGITVCSVMLTIYLIIGERRVAIRKGEHG